MDMGLTDSRAFDANDVETALRPLGWGELCARLVAAQDLRRVQAPDRSGFPTGRDSGDFAPDSGSFHRVAALMLDSIGRREGFVNRTSSSSGKDSQGTSVATREPSRLSREPRQDDENRHD